MAHVLDFITSDHLSALFQVIMIDLVLAGDNAIVIGLAAAGLPEPTWTHTGTPSSSALA